MCQKIDIVNVVLEATIESGRLDISMDEMNELMKRLKKTDRYL